jgi:hypothetical protein
VPTPALEAEPFILLDVHDDSTEIPKEHKQLCINVHASPTNGAGLVIGVLVDTGAEINLIKRGLFPQHFFNYAKRPANLVAANGTILEGGTQEILLHFELRQFRDGQLLPKTLKCQANFYEADIQVDAILGYPWLFYCGVGIFAHHAALALENPLTLLYGLPKYRQREPLTKEFFNDILDDSRCNVIPKSRRRNSKRRRQVRTLVAEGKSIPVSSVLPVLDTFDMLCEHISLCEPHLPPRGKKQSWID